TGLLAAAAVDGDLNTGSKIAEKATTFNYLFHAELVEKEQKLNACTSPDECQSVRDYYNELDAARNREFGQYCQQNPAGCAQVTQQLVDEIPANEQLGDEARRSGSFQRSFGLWLSRQNNQHAINTGIVEQTRAENGDGAALLADVALDALNPGQDLFASTAGGVGGKTGVKVGVVGNGGKNGMLGAEGVQTASKTIWKGTGKERLDVENPNPGQRPGQLHYQDNKGNKYLYDPQTRSFPDAPRSVNQLLKDSRFSQAIDKGMTKYLGAN
uniref:DUF6862 domain-containing protein n=1 Tax=Pseudomonas corrugata TaxID=47879 RepID=UPI0018EF37DA